MTETEAGRFRREYEDHGLVPGDLADDPMSQFDVWFAGARAAGIDEPNAFTLATVDSEGRPSSRAVLLKDVTDKSLVFYTNLNSRKSRDMKQNPRVAATFVWTPIHRQVRFEGAARLVDAAVNDAYFATRPRGARVAAHVSRQSEPIPSRELMEGGFAEADARFGDDIPRPESWGGWEIVVDRVEFWQGRANRFHDRLVYIGAGHDWRVERLQP
jgi:pyridoxamine 5'-phosphate oxidase